MFGVMGILYYSQSGNHLKRLRLEEQINLELQVKLIAEKFETIISDLLFLSQLNELESILNSKSAHAKHLLEKEYLNFAKHKRAYDQVRYLDKSGTEIVRINYNHGSPAIMPAAELQDKGGRYYFQETVALGAGGIYVSPFDLNIEEGAIEKPLKPMIRFAMPVFDSAGVNRGIVILNYLGASLIDLIRESGKMSPGNIMLVNSDGYWLCSPMHDDEWGFMLPGKDEITFSSRFPQAWEQIVETDDDQFLSKNGLFTFKTIYPLKKYLRSGTNSVPPSGEDNIKHSYDNYFWKVISHISEHDLKTGMRNPLLTKLFSIGLVLLALLAFPAWFISQSIVRRRRSRIELYYSAHYDELTQLANLTLFRDRMLETLKESKRYKRQFALLFIDLDWFKSINDTLGHDAGDDVLKLTAERLTNCVRESDTVARIGGDEFAVILKSISATEDAEKVARTLIRQIAAPFNLRNSEKQIGASIGISFYPVHGDQIDTLLTKADAAMYEAKNSGKNQFKISA